MMVIWFLKHKGKILMLLLALGILITAYSAGYDYADTAWQLKWAQRDIRDTAELAKQQLNMRIEEQRHQTAIIKVIQDANQQITTAKNNVVSANSAANKLHAEANRLAKRLEARERCVHSSATTSSTPAASGTRLLAELFRLADEEAGRMAAIADQARIRGLACERAYNELAHK